MLNLNRPAVSLACSFLKCTGVSRIKQRGITVVEVSMALVVFAIIAVVAIPGFSPPQNQRQTLENDVALEKKVKSAFALAIAHKGDFPTLSEIVSFVDADFTSETNNLDGIVFRDQNLRLTVNTYNDLNCEVMTSAVEQGVTDIVRCVHSYN